MSLDLFLTQAFVYLAAAVISVPVAKRLGLGSVLGYLLAGVLRSPGTTAPGAPEPRLHAPPLHLPTRRVRTLTSASQPRRPTRTSRAPICAS